MFDSQANDFWKFILYFENISVNPFNFFEIFVGIGLIHPR